MQEDDLNLPHETRNKAHETVPCGGVDGGDSRTLRQDINSRQRRHLGPTTSATDYTTQKDPCPIVASNYKRAPLTLGGGGGAGRLAFVFTFFATVRL